MYADSFRWPATLISKDGALFESVPVRKISKNKVFHLGVCYLFVQNYPRLRSLTAGQTSGVAEANKTDVLKFLGADSWNPTNFKINLDLGNEGLRRLLLACAKDFRAATINKTLTAILANSSPHAAVVGPSEEEKSYRLSILPPGGGPPTHHGVHIPAGTSEVLGFRKIASRRFTSKSEDLTLLEAMGPLLVEFEKDETPLHKEFTDRLAGLAHYTPAMLKVYAELAELSSKKHKDPVGYLFNDLNDPPEPVLSGKPRASLDSIVEFTLEPKSNDDLLQFYHGIPKEELLGYGDTVFPIHVLWENLDGLHDGSPGLKVEVLDDLFDIPAELKARGRELIRYLQKEKKKVFDAENARLVDFDTQLDGGLRVLLQPTPFHHSVATTHAMDYRSEKWPQTVREMLEPGPSLNPLNETHCSNEIGLNAVLVTSDNMLVLPARSSKVIVTGKMFGPSVSGAFSWESKDEHGHCPFEAIKSEIRKELGISPREIADLRLVGLSRGLIAGGQPCLRFLSWTSLSSKEIEQRLKDTTEDLWEIALKTDRKYIDVGSTMDPETRRGLLSGGGHMSNAARASLIYYWKYLDHHQGR